MTGQHAAPVAANPPADDPVGAILARIDQVRRNPDVSSDRHVTCSSCGPLSAERGQGIASHAVAHPGHVVTAVHTTIYIYQDQEGPIDASRT